MKEIAPVEGIPRSFEILNLLHISKLSGKFVKTSQNNAFQHL